MKDRGTFFAWYPVPMHRLKSLSLGNPFRVWEPCGLAWMRRVSWVRSYMSGEVFYYDEKEEK